MHPKKHGRHLGQHFLVDERLVHLLVEALELSPGDAVVEIGAGKGALTELLVAKNCQVISIEIDPTLADCLGKRLGSRGNLKLLNRDFLTVGCQELPSSFKVIGNIPYSITSHIVEKLLDLCGSIQLAVLTVQAEVADKILAPVGAKEYGLWSVLVQSGFQMEFLAPLPRRAFRPRPEVDSKAIKLRPLRPTIAADRKYREFIRRCFAFKRKTLANALQFSFGWSALDAERVLAECGLARSCRAEGLSWRDFGEIYQCCSAKALLPA